MNKAEFDKRVDYLKKSPIFAMSLGSKELFHSNFWKWIMDQEWGKCFAKSFFNDFNTNGEIKVEREKDNLDLLLTDANGKKYIIENKIKSYPSLNQLCEYSAKHKEMVGGIITGIRKPPFERPEKWDYIQYSYISNEIKNLKAPNEFLQNLLSEYCNVLDSINYLMNEAMNEKPCELSYWTEDIKNLEDIHLMDVFRKLKADDFVFACKEDIENVYTEKAKECLDCNFYIDRSFNNKEATITFAFEIKKGDISKGKIGVQIEGNQYRKFIELTHGSAEEIHQIAKEYGWHDATFVKKGDKVFGRVSSMNKPFCSYSGRWVYQYFNTWHKSEPDKHIQKYDDLKERLKKDLNYAVDNILKNRDRIFY